MSEPLIMTWLWQQNPPRCNFDADKVNRWAAMMRANLTIPHRLACVTDIPDGIDSSIEIIDMRAVVPPALMQLQGPGWDEQRGLPQCYRRLALWRGDAADVFGAEWIASMDVDCVALDNLDDAFTPRYDVRLLKGTSHKRPYNGGLVMLRAGSRPHVFDSITQEGIDASRRLYVGSDQAWISHVLGWKERKFGVEDGIYNWTPRFVNLNRGRMGFMMPGDTRLMFFPNVIKPWHMERSHPAIYSIWSGDRPADIVPKPLPKSIRKRLWALDDPKGWGREFQAAAKAKGYRAWLFRGAQDVSDGEAAFVRLDQQAEQRDISKGVLARLAERGIVTLPTAQEGRWYDDKIAQYLVLKPWMSETWIRTHRDGADALLEELSIEGAFPIISKASEGAGSANVRLLHDDDEAWAEMVTAFGSGIPLKYGRIQQGYVYWQRLVADNAHDYRVCITGDQAYGLIRLNKPGTPFASGSGKNYPLTLKDEREQKAFALAWAIADGIGTRWMAFDFVFDGDEPKVLEMSSAWTMSAYRECPAFSRKGAVIGAGRDSFRIAVEVLDDMIERAKKAA